MNNYCKALLASAISFICLTGEATGAMRIKNVMAQGAKCASHIHYKQPAVPFHAVSTAYEVQSAAAEFHEKAPLTQTAHLHQFYKEIEESPYIKSQHAQGTKYYGSISASLESQKTIREALYAMECPQPLVPIKRLDCYKRELFGGLCSATCTWIDEYTHDPVFKKYSAVHEAAHWHLQHGLQGILYGPEIEAQAEQEADQLALKTLHTMGDYKTINEMIYRCTNYKKLLAFGNQVTLPAPETRENILAAAQALNLWYGKTMAWQ